MSRPSVATITLAVLSFVFLAAAISCELEHRSYPTKLAGLAPFRVPMSASEPIRSSFTAVWSEPHYVALLFPADVDPEIAEELRRASGTVGSLKENPVLFDFYWQVHEGGSEVGRGSGHSKPTGSFGSREQGLSFGSFQAVAGHVYQVHVTPGPEFSKWTRAQPSIEVGVNTAAPSVGLAWSRALDRPFVFIFSCFGLMFLAGTIWTLMR